MMQDKRQENEYLARTVGNILPGCLKEISEKRPSDPVEYMARWLYKYADSEIDRYNKCEWLRELELARKELERERKQREANLRAMRQKVKGLKSQLVGEGGEGIAWRTGSHGVLGSGSDIDMESRSDDKSDMHLGEHGKVAYRTLVIAPGPDRKWNIQQLEARRLSGMKTLKHQLSSGEVKSPHYRDPHAPHREMSPLDTSVTQLDSRSSPHDPRQPPRLKLLTEQDGEPMAAGSEEGLYYGEQEAEEDEKDLMKPKHHKRRSHYDPSRPSRGQANNVMAKETTARRDPYFMDVTKLGSKRTRNPAELLPEDKLTLVDVTLFPEGEEEPRSSFVSGSDGSRRGSRAGRIPPSHATWTYLEQCGVLVCMHPILGHLMSRQPPDTADFLDAWFSNDFKCMSVYDHELYTVCDGSSGSLKWSD